LKNYKLIIQYDGTNYSGWQIQKNAETIQHKITEAVEVILKQKINLIGSGRTDSGVHSIGRQQILGLKQKLIFINLNIHLTQFCHQIFSFLQWKK